MTNLNQIPTNFNGAITLFHKEKKIINQVQGYQNLPNELANQEDTLFGVASAGKAFVAVAIMKLVERKKISLSDDLQSVLGSDLGNIQPDITVQELLSHTSGIQDYFDEEVLDDYADLWQDFPNYRIRNNRDLFPLFFNKPLNKQRRGEFIYNNSGYVMLAAIIEKITNLPFDEYIAQEVFKPANMKRTGYYELDRLPKNTAIGYVFDREKQEYYSNIYSIDAKGTGAGGAFTTVEDIHHFWKSLNTGRILHKETVKQLFTVQASDEEEHYGLGFWLTEIESNVFIPHFEGMDPGACFYSQYDFYNDIEVTAISNKEDNVWKIVNDLVVEIR